PMSLTFFPAGLPHANCWHGEGGRVLHLEFASAWLEKLGSRTRVLHRPGDFARGAPLSLMRRLAVEIAHQDGATPLAVEGLVLELVAACARCEPGALEPRASSSRRWLARAEALLRERFQAPLSLDYIASEVHVSADHLAREFRKRLGCTVGEYVRDLRLEFAAGKLVHSDEPLAHIAEAAGFADQSHFTRVFRRKFGVTPGAYRMSKRTHR
ncbi:MAG: helix-turn-helix transcriptional regulator, partial [Burkholderiales bacterium]|nr:helix-turn-helix transcriptional regulator [Burkholderiales bacterium]